MKKKKEWLINNTGRKTYQIADETSENKTYLEISNKAAELNTDYCVNKIEKEQSVFVTIKYHKKNFKGNQRRRPIDTSKDHIGHVGKTILKKICCELRQSLALNQLKNTE